MTKTEWIKVIENCNAHGTSIRLWCEQNGIKYSTYQYWARKIKCEKRMWAEVSVPATSISREIKISCDKWTIIADEGTSISLLTNVLKAVDSICC